jgi:hypothetical protein
MVTGEYYIPIGALAKRADKNRRIYFLKAAAKYETISKYNKTRGFSLKVSGGVMPDSVAASPY